MYITFLYLILIFISVAATLTAILLAGALVTLFIVKVPYVPTPKRNVKLIIDLLELKTGEVFYDLGCGDGRFLIEATKRGAKAIGFEVSPWAYLRAKFNIWVSGSKAEVFYQNFYQADLSAADAVYCFLIDSVMPKVEEKLKRDLKKGARIICYGFKLPTWPPNKIVDYDARNKKSSNIYIYHKTI
ncbi:MAG: class I SAM-dependent methyltransferase [Candidatus Magasanikbacteria bacterium]|nr:class I SAM-dependent methyltransferase [Candidatus Magasanikbacteria bacterium]